jgi:predicted  nucleic acid-binding Zn-ribbon protein
MVDRVEKARDTQTEAKEQFNSALERFQVVLGKDGGELQDRYEQLNDEYEESKALADEVRGRIDSVEDVSEALFEEWEQEITEYSSQKLASMSRRKLIKTRSQYKTMISAMRRAEKSMKPVLTTLHDQVLYLKHNLNAQTISSLKEELGEVKTDVAVLVKRMEASIDEANQFINSIQ